MKKVEVASADVHKAYRNWCDFCHKHEYKTNTKSFLDYLDPARQTDLYQTDLESNNSFTTLRHFYEVPEATYKRIKLLAGSYSYAALMANKDRFSNAHVSWGKKYGY